MRKSHIIMILLGLGVSLVVGVVVYKLTGHSDVQGTPQGGHSGAAVASMVPVWVAVFVATQRRRKKAGQVCDLNSGKDDKDCS